MKPKVILDIGFLGHSHDDQSGRRGAQRVAQHLFDGLLALGQCDLSFVATSHLAGAYDFLANQNLPPDKKLLFSRKQLDRSRRGRKISRAIQSTIEDRSLPARLHRRLQAEVAHWCLRGEIQIPPAGLAAADIYHSPHTPFPPVIQQQPQLRKFLTCHDFIPLKNPEYFSPKAKLFMNAVLACLTPKNFAFCVSEITRQDVLNLAPHLPPEHVFVTPLAADPNLFHPISEPELLAEIRVKYRLGDAPYFLALSALDPHKNFPHLIKCFGTLVEAGELCGHRLVIVGSNPSRNPEVQKTMARFPHIQEHIILPGFIPDEDLAAVYSGATAFLFPSFAEGFGIPPLEAMQCGVPVIASNTTSIPEVVGNAGLLLAPTDRDGWCQAMLNLLHTPQLRAELADRSLARAKLFSWQRFIDETVHGYNFSYSHQP